MRESSAEGATAPRKKNARESYRLRSDAEVVAEELDKVIRTARGIVAKLHPDHLAEMDERQPQGSEPSVEAEMLHALGTIKGQMYLERVAAGLSAGDLEAGSGWREHTLRQFENREADAVVSSLFRYAAGLRAAGVRGHVEIRWVPEQPAGTVTKFNREVKASDDLAA